MKPYVPQSLPPLDLDFGRLIGLVGRANAAVARYDGMLQSLVNPAILLSPINDTRGGAVVEDRRHASNVG